MSIDSQFSIALYAQSVGFKIVKCGSYKINIKRTWKQRLFSRPWQPSRTHDVKIESLVQPGQVVVDGVMKVIYCAPDVYNKIQSAEVNVCTGNIGDFQSIANAGGL